MRRGVLRQTRASSCSSTLIARLGALCYIAWGVFHVNVAHDICHRLALPKQELPVGRLFQLAAYMPGGSRCSPSSRWAAGNWRKRREQAIGSILSSWDGRISFGFWWWCCLGTRLCSAGYYRPQSTCWGALLTTRRAAARGARRSAQALVIWSCALVRARNARRKHLQSAMNADLHRRF